MTLSMPPFCQTQAITGWRIPTTRSITINGRTISATDLDETGDFIIDCERQDIYLAETKANYNNSFTLSDGEFFELHPGRNTVYFTGINSSVFITPCWWTV